MKERTRTTLLMISACPALGILAMPAKFEIKKAKDGQFFFNLKAANGEKILKSEMYKARASATKGIESVKKNAPDDKRYERKKSSSGKPYFVLKAANNQITGTSEMYSSTAAMENVISSVKSNAPGAVVEEG